MNKKIALILGVVAALIASLAVFTVTTSPSQAAANRWPGGQVIHHSPDNGYDAPWSIYCHDGRDFSLHEGQWSRTLCPDVYQISVRAGYVLLCGNGSFYGERRYFYPGVHIISRTADWRCVHQVA